MLSTDNQRISEIFERLAEIAAKTAELTSNPNLSPPLLKSRQHVTGTLSNMIS